MRFNEEDKYWILKCVNNPDIYRIMIDINKIYIVNMQIDKMLHQFKLNGSLFIEQLLDFIGCLVEEV